MQEPRPPFVSKKLQQIFGDSFMNEIAELVRTKTPYLDSIDAIEFQHGRCWTSPANELGDKSGEIEQHVAECSIALEDIAKGDPKIIFNHIATGAQKMTSSIDHMFFGKIDEVTSRTGNIVNSADYNSQFETFLAMLEKIEMSVDENGNLNPPTLVLAPGYRAELQKILQEASPEMRKRFDRIMAKKLADATRKEAERISRFEKRES